MIFLTINWPNFVYLLVDPRFLFPPKFLWSILLRSPYGMDAPDRHNGQTDVSLSVRLSDGVWHYRLTPLPAGGVSLGGWWLSLSQHRSSVVRLHSRHCVIELISKCAVSRVLTAQKLAINTRWVTATSVGQSCPNCVHWVSLCDVAHRWRIMNWRVTSSKQLYNIHTNARLSGHTVAPKKSKPLGTKLSMNRINRPSSGQDICITFERTKKHRNTISWY